MISYFLAMLNPAPPTTQICPGLDDVCYFVILLRKHENKVCTYLKIKANNISH